MCCAGREGEKAIFIKYSACSWIYNNPQDMVRFTLAVTLTFFTLILMSIVSLFFIFAQKWFDFGTWNKISHPVKSKNKTYSEKLNFHPNVKSINMESLFSTGIRHTSSKTGHHNESDTNLNKENTKEKDVIKIGILIPSSTRRLTNPSLEKLSLVKLCLPSFYKTLEQKYNYVIYIGIDKGDYMETVKDKLENFDHVKVVLSSGRTFTQSANIIARKAYEDGMDYLVRINDDSTFETSEWSSKGITVLQGYIPKNIGVVGPTCKEGNTRILTHDMVHRTHIEIFDFYYPPYFDNWWIDDWITDVYSPNRSIKLSTWVMKHHLKTHGTRYNVDFKKYARLGKILNYDKERLAEYISKLKR